MTEVKVCAEITGVVCQIMKTPGETVAAGEDLLMLESMKMEIPLEAPVSGQVLSVDVAEGQAVSEGDVVVTISAE